MQKKIDIIYPLVMNKKYLSRLTIQQKIEEIETQLNMARIILFDTIFKKKELNKIKG